MYECLSNPAFGCQRLVKPVYVMLADEELAVTNVYGHPLPTVMKLMRVIATAGRHVAAMLVCVLDHRLILSIL